MILDPARIGEPLGSDLLNLYSTTEAGDAVCRAGIAIAILNIDEADYTIVVRDVADASYLSATPSIISTGWILETETGSLGVCGAGYLTRWNPAHAKLSRIVVSPGRYKVQVNAGVNQQGMPEEEWVYELVLTPSPDAAFAADLAQSLNFC